MGTTSDQSRQQSAGCELDCFVIRQVEGKISRLVEPANSGYIVSESKDAVLFAACLLALDEH